MIWVGDVNASSPLVVVYTFVCHFVSDFVIINNVETALDSHTSSS